MARGFTLIEQIAVITALGATSAVALPQFIDLKREAESTLLASLAGAAGSAMVINQAGCLVTGHQPTAGKCQTVSDCQQASGLLLADLPVGYHIAPALIAADADRFNGLAGSCTLVQDDIGASAGFVGLSAGH